VIGIIGFKDSGKTYAAELIIKILTKYNLKIATVKHIHNTDFTIDKECSDSHRMRLAGADIVSIAAPQELTFIFNDEVNYEKILKVIMNYECDVIIIEGFKKKVLDNPNIIKVLCIKSMEDLQSFKAAAKGKILAVCSLQRINKNLLVLRQDDNKLRDIVSDYIEEWREIKTILERLPGLDCKKCGYSTCLKMAEVIKRGDKKNADCTIFKSSSLLDIKITINNSKISLQPFVAKIIHSTIIGMLSSLKGVTIEGDEKIKLEIYKSN